MHQKTKTERYKQNPDMKFNEDDVRSKKILFTK